MTSKLLGPDGKPIPDAQAVKYNGHTYPYRVINQEVLQHVKIDPMIGIMAIAVQMGDQNNLLWLALAALAKDVYSRQPQGSQEFLQLAKELKLNIIDVDRNSTDIAEELSKLF